VYVAKVDNLILIGAAAINGTCSALDIVVWFGFWKGNYSHYLTDRIRMFRCKTNPK